MTYEEFMDLFKKRAHEELGYSMESMKFYPKGYTSDDPHQIEWIKDSNRLYTGEESTKLMLDILKMEMPEIGGVKNYHRMAIHRLYEDSLKDGFDKVFKKIEEDHKNVTETPVEADRIAANMKR